MVKKITSPCLKNRFKAYIFDSIIITRILESMTQVLQHIDDHDLICYLFMIKYSLLSESLTCK